MELTIKTPFARLTVDVDPAQALHLVQQALNCATSADLPQPAPTCEQPEPATEPVKVNGPVLGEKPPATAVVLYAEGPAAPEAEKTLAETTQEPWKRYGGFLHIVCEKCKTARSFRPKQPIFFNKCACGHSTILKNMVPARVRCKCGKSWTYLTNEVEATLSMTSLCCGAPVDLEYNPKERGYVTIGESKHK